MDDSARVSALRFAAKISVQEGEAGGAAQEAPDAAIQMDQVARSPWPSESAEPAEILQVEEPHSEPLPPVIRNHHVGFLQITRVEPGIMDTPH